MKKLFTIIAILVLLLPSCGKINDEIDALGNRIDMLEQETIPTIDEQIAAINITLGNLDAMDKELKGYIDNLTSTASSLQEQINTANTKIGEVKAELKGDISTAKADVLAELESLETELKNELSQINSTIDILKAKDVELDQKITDLRTYVDRELDKATDWVNATFATLEQYNALVSEIATIKEQIKSINESITALETRLITKINDDIASAVSTLSADIQQKVSEITTAYTDAVKAAKEEITAAYTTAIQTAITTLDASLKSWVGEQLSGYYTIAEIDALISTLSAEFEGKLLTQKIYLESLISSLSQTLTSKIADNNNLIAVLRNDLTTLDGEVAKNTEAIANNAEKISDNAASIIENSKAIVANSENIEKNKGSIEANTKLIAENKQLIAEVETKIDGTSSAENTKAIAKNAKAIADNAELIAQNSVAINNNAAAIAQNTTDIAQLQQNLVTTKSEITEAYKSAISTAITTLDGELRGEIATQVSTLSTRIDNEVANINSAIDALTARVVTLENDVTAIKKQIAKILSDIADMKEDIANLLARIQSVTYVPKYSDGNATMDCGTKTAEFDFLISPKSAVAELANVWSEALSVKAVYTQTRAVEFVEMPIEKFESDVTNGTISITASGENLSAEFFAGTQSASVRLSISDGNNSIVSDFIPMVIPMVAKGLDEMDCANNEILYRTTTGYPIRMDYYSAANNKISNIYEDGVGRVTFDSDITEIPAGLFRFGTPWTLCEIRLPDSVTSIADEAFDGCTSLTSITIPDNVSYISGLAFYGSAISAIYGKCTTEDNQAIIMDGCLTVVLHNGLIEYAIPDGITSIGNHVFYGCTSLESVIIPDSVTSIGTSAFSGCSSLTSITIPDSVTSIGACVFRDCSSLTSVTIPDSVTSIGTSAFSGCSSLTSITIPDSVTSIGTSAFSGCSSLTSITIPDSVTSIGAWVFYDCSSLTNVYCKPTTPPSIDVCTFGGTDEEDGSTIYVPAESVSAYKSEWSGYAEYIKGYDF